MKNNFLLNLPCAFANYLATLFHDYHIVVTFEMRTVLYEIHLFNDTLYKHGDHIHMKRKEGEREQDSRETERDSVCVREGGWQQVEVAPFVKMTVEENGIVGIRIGLRR